LERKNSRYLLEPVGRNTAPAIALACMACDKEELVFVTPSDHLIKDETAYAKVLETVDIKDLIIVDTADALLISKKGSSQKVKPGKRLSLQKHYHRNEHWIVVSGTATVTVGTETKIIRLNESTYIKMGEVHRLANEGMIPVVLIEAQVAEYTGEDDIVRFDDDYKRD